MKPIDRDILSAFLSSDVDQTYAPQCGEVTGLLKQMKETMERYLAETEEKEANAIDEFEAMVAAKTKLINAICAEIEKKLSVWAMLVSSLLN